MRLLRRRLVTLAVIFLLAVPSFTAPTPVCAQTYPNGCGACFNAWTGYTPYGDFGWINQNGCGGGYCLSAFVVFNDGWSMFYQFGCRNYFDQYGVWSGHSYCGVPLTVEDHPY